MRWQFLSVGGGFLSSFSSSSAPTTTTTMADDFHSSSSSCRNQSIITCDRMEWQFREKSGPVISCIPGLASVPQSEDAIPPFLENIPSPHLISWVVRKKRYRTIGRVGGRRIISFRRQLVALFLVSASVGGITWKEQSRSCSCSPKKPCSFRRQV